MSSNPKGPMEAPPMEAPMAPQDGTGTTQAYSLEDIMTAKVGMTLEDLSQPASSVTTFERPRHVSVVVYAGTAVLPSHEETFARLGAPSLPVILRWVSSGKPENDRAALDWIEAFDEKLRPSKRAVRIFPSFETSKIANDAFITDLATALRQLNLLKPGTPNPEIVEAFQRAVLTFFRFQLNAEVKIGKPNPRKPGPGLEGFSSWMEFKGGSTEVAAALTIPADSIEPLVQRMIGDTSKLKLQEIWSGTCEFLNIISGLAKAHLNAKGYSIKSQGLPALYVPEYRQSLFDEDGSTRVEIPLETPHGRAELELRFYN